MKVEETLKILTSNDFDKFVGVAEDHHFECKGAPYRLDDNKQKQDLAKDVCGFANSEGGVIVIGLETEISPEHPGEEVSRVRPFRQDLFKIKQYRDVLNSWVYPSISGLEIKWYPTQEDGSKGLGALIVPKQDHRSLPFLITRYVDDDGKSNEIVFGFSQRKLDEVHHYSVQKIHHLIQQGITNEAVSQKLETIEAFLISQTEGVLIPGIEKETKTQQSEITGTRTVYEKRESVINSRIYQALETVRVGPEPAFVLYVFPIINTSVTTLLATRNSEVTSILRNPPQLRHHGFGLETDQEPILVKGQFRRSLILGYKIVEFWRDGSLIFAATGGDEFLCWGRRKKIHGGLRINPITLIETTYLFCETIRQLFRYTEPKNPHFKIGISFKNIKTENTFCGLAPGPVGTIGWEVGNNLRAPPEPDFNFEHLWSDGEAQPELIAFLLVREVYAWYGLEFENMPYVKTIGDSTTIDVEALKAL